VIIMCTVTDSVKHLQSSTYMSGITGSNCSCCYRVSCVLVSFPLVLCVGFCIYLYVTYRIVSRCWQTVDWDS